MKNQYYLKDKKCMIYRPETVIDEIGNHTTEYIPTTATPIWCYARQLSQKEKEIAGLSGYPDDRFFVVNAKSEVETGYRIEYRGATYSITRVDTQNDYNTDIFLYATSSLTD